MDWSGITRGIVGALGDAATYRFCSGASASVRAVLHESLDVMDETGQIIERVRAVTLTKADLPDVVRVGDGVTIGSRVWVVQRTLSDDGYAVQVVVS